MRPSKPSDASLASCWAAIASSLGGGRGPLGWRQPVEADPALAFDDLGEERHAVNLPRTGCVSRTNEP